jgi:hypothetical protein
MSVDVTQLLADVYSGVAEVGRSVTITSYADTYSPTTGNTTRTPTTYTLLASPPYNQSRGVTTDSQPRGSAQLVIPAQGVTFTIQAGQKLTTGGKVYTITVVGRLEVGSTLIAYELTLQEGAP